MAKVLHENIVQIQVGIISVKCLSYIQCAHEQPMTMGYELVIHAVYVENNWNEIVYPWLELIAIQYTYVSPWRDKCNATARWTLGFEWPTAK